MAAIFIVSSNPRAGPPAGLSDKAAHVLAFGGLSGLWVRGFAKGRWAGVTSRAAASAALAASVYGALDEWHQSFVPPRSAEIGDFFADALGAIVAAGLLLTWGIIVANRRRS